MSVLGLTNVSLWEVGAAVAPVGIAVLVYWYIKGRETLDQVDTMFPRSRDDERAQDSAPWDGHADDEVEVEDEDSETA